MQVVSKDVLRWKDIFPIAPVKEKAKKKLLKNNIEFFQDQRILNSLLGSDEQVNYFLEHAFQRNPIVRTNNSVEPILGMFHDLDVLTLLKETSSDSIHVWLRQLQSETLESITVDDPEQAYKLYQAGHSLYCRAPKEVEQTLVSRLSNELHYGLKNIYNNDRYRRGEIEMFFSRKGHLTKFHTDFQENFTIQLKGSKKWRFKTSTAFAPIRGCTLHFNDVHKHGSLIEQQLKVLKCGDIHFNGQQVTNSDPRHTEEEQPKKRQKTFVGTGNSAEESHYTTVVLQEGDIMYHPAGIWHEVECIEDSISMNISLTAASYADIFCNHLQQLLLEQPLWRSAVFRPQHDIKFYPAATEVMTSILNSVPKLLQGIQAEDLLPFPITNPLPEMTKNDQRRDRKAGSDSENSDNEEEEEEEENMDFEEMEGSEEGGATDHDEILLEGVDLTFFLREQIKSIGDQSTLTHNQLFHYFTRFSFRINPFATLLSSVEVYQTSGAILSNDQMVSNSSPQKWIIHAGYGNETLESICRKVLVIGETEEPVEEDVRDRLLLAMAEIEKKYYRFREQRQSVLGQQSNCNVHKSEELEVLHSQVPVFTLADFCSFTQKFQKQSQQKQRLEQRLMQLLLALYYTGFFSSFRLKDE